MRNQVIAFGFLVAGFAAAASLTGVATAQNTPPPATTGPVSACTSLPEADCTTVAGCVWLPGYKVASGEEVKGYCRPAPKPLTARRPPAPAAQ